MEEHRVAPDGRQSEDPEDEAPSKRPKQENDLEPQVPVGYILCDDSSDKETKLAGESAELDVSKGSKGECEGKIGSSGAQRNVCRNESGDSEQETRLDGTGEGPRERGRVRSDPGGGSDKPVKGREGDLRQMVCRRGLCIRFPRGKFETCKLPSRHLRMLVTPYFRHEIMCCGSLQGRCPRPFGCSLVVNCVTMSRPHKIVGFLLSVPHVVKTCHSTCSFQF